MDEKNDQNGEVEAVDEPEVNYRGIKAMPFIIGNETFEKLGAVGLLSNLLVYLTSVFHMKGIAAANVVYVFNGTTNLGTLIGAFLCDTYFGRYKTLGFSTFASFLGLLVIALTAAIKVLHPPHCGEEGKCIGPKTWQVCILYSGFGLLMIGASGVRPCNMAFGVDQFNPNTESGKRGINSFFNWYVFTLTFAQMVSVTAIVYIQTNIGWGIGLAIPAFLMFVSGILFFAGSKIYVKVRATGSPLKSVLQVIVVAIKKSRLPEPGQPWLSLFNYIPPESINCKLPYTDQFRCLEKAAIKAPNDKTKPDGSPANPWGLCSMQQVEELKCLVRVVPIWAATILYSVAIFQQHTFSLFQALQSDRHLANSFSIPAASYYVFQMLGLTLSIPIYDRVLVPFLRKITGKEGGITLLQRIGVGIFLSILTMILAALVEERRRSLALKNPIGIEPRRGAISPLSGLWLVPQLTLAGLAEAFAMVGKVEFYYKQFPENMRSIAGSLFFCGTAMSSYLSSFLVTVVHRVTRNAATGNWLPEDLNSGRLDCFYYLIAVLGVLNFAYFLLCANWYRYKGTGGGEFEVSVAERRPHS